MLDVIVIYFILLALLPMVDKFGGITSSFVHHTGKLGWVSPWLTFQNMSEVGHGPFAVNVQRALLRRAHRVRHGRAHRVVPQGGLGDRHQLALHALVVVDDLEWRGLGHARAHDGPLELHRLAVFFTVAPFHL